MRFASDLIFIIALLLKIISNQTILIDYVVLSGNYYTFFTIGKPEDSCLFKIDLIQNKTWVTPEGYKPTLSRTKEIEFSDKFSLFSNSKIFIGERRNDLFLLELPNIVIDKFPFYYIKTIDLPRGGLGLGYKFENTSLSIVHTLKEQGYIKSLSFGFYKLFDSERYLFFGDVYQNKIQDQYKAEIVVDNNSEYWGGQLEQIEINDEITVINEPFKLQSSHQVLYVPFRIFNHIVSKYFTNYIDQHICEKVDSYNITGIVCDRKQFEENPFELNITFYIQGIKYTLTTIDLLENFGVDTHLKIKHSLQFYDEWVLGNLFFRKYLTVFSYDNHTVTFYYPKPFISYSNKTSSVIPKIYLYITIIDILMIISLLYNKYAINTKQK